MMQHIPQLRPRRRIDEAKQAGHQSDIGSKGADGWSKDQEGNGHDQSQRGVGGGENASKLHRLSYCPFQRVALMPWFRRRDW